VAYIGDHQPRPNESDYACYDGEEGHLPRNISGGIIVAASSTDTAEPNPAREESTFPFVNGFFVSSFSVFSSVFPVSPMSLKNASHRAFRNAEAASAGALLSVLAGSRRVVNERIQGRESWLRVQLSLHPEYTRAAPTKARGWLTRAPQ
jgi:hypothetical protein